MLRASSGLRKVLGSLTLLAASVSRRKSWVVLTPRLLRVCLREWWPSVKSWTAFCFVIRIVLLETSGREEKSLRAHYPKIFALVFTGNVALQKILAAFLLLLYEVALLNGHLRRRKILGRPRYAASQNQIQVALRLAPLNFSSWTGLQRHLVPRPNQSC